MTTRLRVTALLAIGVLCAMSLPAEGATRADCRSACTMRVADDCAAFRRPKARRCRTQIERICQRVGVSTACPSPTTTTFAPVVVTTTTTTTSPPTTTTVPANVVPVCGGQRLVVSHDGTYLGCLTCSPYSPESVLNVIGSYGSAYSATSINNQYSSYGSRYSTYSACNQYASAPPYIVDQQRCSYGRMSLNAYVPDSVCGFAGNADVCRLLAILCAS